MTILRDLFDIELPILQAPMAGVQGSALAVAVSNAGGLGALPGAMLSPDGLRQELTAIRSGTDHPFNVNFFCHREPAADAARETAWRAALAPSTRNSGSIRPRSPPAPAAPPSAPTPPTSWRTSSPPW